MKTLQYPTDSTLLMSDELEARVGNLLADPTGSGPSLSIPSLFAKFDVVGWDTNENSISIHVPPRYLSEFFMGLPLHGLVCDTAVIVSHTSAERNEGMWTVRLFLNDTARAG